MNVNRLRPTEGDKKDLALWLSSVVNDAIRDAQEAGLSHEDTYHLLKQYTNAEKQWVPRNRQ